MDNDEIVRLLRSAGLKVTPQRVTIIDAIMTLGNHPTADRITEFIRKNHPGIATGTVYKSLETLVSRGIIRKVMNEGDSMRYDAVTERHHHLYCSGSDRIEDYYDSELTELIDKYLISKKIPGFTIENVRLQINGRFTDK